MRSGTLIIAVHNLDMSGANQVLINVINAQLNQTSNVLVVSPRHGPAVTRFTEVGASIRIGNAKKILEQVSDILLVICNTIMSADVVLLARMIRIPCIWILHEYWSEGQIAEQIKMRPNAKHITIDIIKRALHQASTVVFVCEAQRDLYHAMLGHTPAAPSRVIYVGVPVPVPAHSRVSASASPPPVTQSVAVIGGDIPRNGSTYENEAEIHVRRTDTSMHDVSACGSSVNLPSSRTFTILVLGIVCPRKNQLWAVRMFDALHKAMIERQHQRGEEEQHHLSSSAVNDMHCGQREQPELSPVRHAHGPTLGGEAVSGSSEEEEEEEGDENLSIVDCNDGACFDPLVRLLDKSDAGQDAAHLSGSGDTGGQSDAGRVSVMKVTEEPRLERQPAGGYSTEGTDPIGHEEGLLRLLVVGVRHTRPYESAYVAEVEECAAQVNKNILERRRRNSLSSSSPSPVRASYTHSASDGTRHEPPHADAREEEEMPVQILPVTDDIDKYFEQADCLLLPSTNEVTPLVILEAMARGLPVVSTNIGGVNEMFTHGLEGYNFSLDSLPCHPEHSRQCHCEGEEEEEEEEGKIEHVGRRSRTIPLFNSGDFRTFLPNRSFRKHGLGGGGGSGCGNDSGSGGTVSVPEIHSRESAPTQDRQVQGRAQEEHGQESKTDCYRECIQYLLSFIASPALTATMGRRGRERFQSVFDIRHMTAAYTSLINALVPPVVLVDMDGVIVDWDRGFMLAWELLFEEYNRRARGCAWHVDGSAGRGTATSATDNGCFLQPADLEHALGLIPASHPAGSPAPAPERTTHFDMLLCLSERYRPAAGALFHSKGFFASLPPKEGAVEALYEMHASGITVLICSAPLVSSTFSAQEKLNWLGQHMGEAWLNRAILTCSKQGMKGDLLIDDKPISALDLASQVRSSAKESDRPHATTPGKGNSLVPRPSWKQVMFSMPYNSSAAMTGIVNRAVTKTRIQAQVHTGAAAMASGESSEAALQSRSTATEGEIDSINDEIYLHSWKEWRRVILPLIGMHPEAGTHGASQRAVTAYPTVTTAGAPTTTIRKGGTPASIPSIGKGDSPTLTQPPPPAGLGSTNRQYSLESSATQVGHDKVNHMPEASVVTYLDIPITVIESGSAPSSKSHDRYRGHEKIGDSPQESVPSPLFLPHTHGAGEQAVSDAIFATPPISPMMSSQSSTNSLCGEKQTLSRHRQGTLSASASTSTSRYPDPEASSQQRVNHPADVSCTCHSGTTLCPRVADEETKFRSFLSRLPERARHEQAGAMADIVRGGEACDRGGDSSRLGNSGDAEESEPPPNPLHSQIHGYGLHGTGHPLAFRYPGGSFPDTTMRTTVPSTQPFSPSPMYNGDDRNHFDEASDAAVPDDAKGPLWRSTGCLGSSTTDSSGTSLGVFDLCANQHEGI